MKSLIMLLLLSILSLPLFSQGEEGENRDYKISLEGEVGYIGFLLHTYQSGDPGTKFDYIRQGGQDILFPLSRLAAELELFQSHKISFLYQPFEVGTTVAFRDDVTIDGKLFEDGSIVDIRYSFPFWRLTYLYDFFPEDKMELAVGAALQLRNASVSFQQISGPDPTTLEYANSQNLGPVPALALRGGYRFDSGLYLWGEATGIFASSSFINGADFDFEGSLLDTSLQIGLPILDEAEAYVKLRFLMGSARGDTEFVDRTWSEGETSFTENYLITWAPTLGFRVMF